MTTEEQKKIFSRNLRKYMDLNQKQQIDVARDLGINPTTLNMWCTGNSMPSTGKIRKLATYFGIGITDLTDEKPDGDINDEYTDVTMKIGLYDERFKKIIIAYHNLSKEKRDLICDFLKNLLFEKKQVMHLLFLLHIRFLRIRKSISELFRS